MKTVVAFVAALLAVQQVLAREPYVDYLPNLPSSSSRAIETEQVYLSQPLDEEAHFFRRVSAAKYKSVVRSAAKGTPSSLSLIFSSAPYQDGAGAEGYASTLFWLLHQVGDSKFATQLLRQPRSIRSRVVGFLDFAADYDYSTSFPKTFRVAKHLHQ